MNFKVKVHITFSGILARYTGNEKVKIELPENACFEDLMSEIGRRYGGKMPQLIWNEARASFTHHVLAMKGFKNLTDLKEPLNNGDDIKFLLVQAGG